MKTPLRFSKDGKFKIMICGDPHVKANLDTNLLKRKDIDTRALLEAAIEKTNPDLVVIMGDIITADNREEYRLSSLNQKRRFL